MESYKAAERRISLMMTRENLNKNHFDTWLKNVDNINDETYGMINLSRNILVYRYCLFHNDYGW